MMTAWRRDSWPVGDGRNVLVLSPMGYNEIAAEPTIVVVPMLTGEPVAVVIASRWRHPAGRADNTLMRNCQAPD
jgi:hypothetical protein